MALDNREQLRTIIKNDCQVRHQYIDLDGQTCAIGGMLKATGYDMNQFLYRIPGKSWTLNLIGILDFVDAYAGIAQTNPVQHLIDTFNLSHEDLVAIQDLNDTIADREARIEAILAYIDAIDNEAAA